MSQQFTSPNSRLKNMPNNQYYQPKVTRNPYKTATNGNNSIRESHYTSSTNQIRVSQMNSTYSKPSLRNSSHIHIKRQSINSTSLRSTNYARTDGNENKSVRVSQYTPQEILNSPNISIKRVVMNSKPKEEEKVESTHRAREAKIEPVFDSMMRETGNFLIF